ncbi:hypothetical protein MLD38_009847 [Melastoma candidum]|uniref:Uncharacterized protein n=1 Tax=Melastoma candidum TaxID=119954 RepID=A0ACB9RZE8_9MYRT|nr:hypothetical protein MLD38_009847 [Melastoma candidum]
MATVSLARLCHQLHRTTPRPPIPAVTSGHPRPTLRCRRHLSSSLVLCSASQPAAPQGDSSAAGSGGGSSIVGGLLDYLNESWTQFHATAEAKRQLIDAGFHLLNENEEWILQPGRRYFFTRNMSCLVAFAVGERYEVGSGFHPYIWIAQLTKMASSQIWKQHLIPLLSIKPEETSTDSKEKEGDASLKGVHHPLLLQVLSEEVGCDADDIVSIELNLCDTQPSCLGGGNNEFIFSGRLDNLASSYCALRALIDSCEVPGDLSSEHAIRMVALFDNEEVGSDSFQGAGAPTMFQAMRRIIHSLARRNVDEDAVERAIRKSFLVSADMAHGVHPNFTDKHEEHHRPEMQKGLVIKHNANQRYATSGITAFLFKEVGRIRGLPTQDFAVRNDMGCGSTIGPILASGVGIRTVDCGIPQLSMHSVREVCGKEDVDTAYQHFKAFYEGFSEVDRRLVIDY